MEFFREIGANSVLWTAILGWFVAQVIKFILVLISSKSLDFGRLVGSGGMPSSHSSIVSAMAAAVGFERGFDSIEFAICTVVAFVVMYDACGVRRSAGQHAKILNGILQKDGEQTTKALKELLGHSPLEVFAGALLGIIIAAIVHF